jgi:hypothetical protein
MISAGEELTKLLDSASLDVIGSLWFYSSEFNEWRLVLVIAQVESEGPKEVYTKINDMISKHLVNSVPLEKIVVASPKDRLFQLMRGAVQTEKGISHIRFTANVINNILIEDALIYRLV